MDVLGGWLGVVDVLEVSVCCTMPGPNIEKLLLTSINVIGFAYLEMSKNGLGFSQTSVSVDVNVIEMSALESAFIVIPWNGLMFSFPESEVFLMS